MFEDSKITQKSPPISENSGEVGLLFFSLHLLLTSLVLCFH